MQLSIGSRGKPVFNIQARLLALGYTRDAADGIYGPATLKAVSLFQGENRLPITGVVDQPLYDLILSDQAPPHAAAEISQKYARQISGQTQLHCRESRTARKVPHR